MFSSDHDNETSSNSGANTGAAAAAAPDTENAAKDSNSEQASAGSDTHEQKNEVNRPAARRRVFATESLRPAWLQSARPRARSTTQRRFHRRMEIPGKAWDAGRVRNAARRSATRGRRMPKRLRRRMKRPARKR